MGKEMITEINKETFWQIVGKAYKQCGQDMDASIEWMKQKLLSMPSKQSLRFHAAMHGYREAANKYGLWTAAAMIKGSGCSDDSFIDFRAWLIAQEKEIYMAALKNPDSLADIVTYGACGFGAFHYVGNSVYEELTGRSAYEDCTSELSEKLLAEISRDIEYHPMVEYPLDMGDAGVIYPKLGTKFMERHNRRDSRLGSMWNTSLPEIRRLQEKGACRAQKFREAGCRGKNKPKKWDGESR